MSLIKSNWNCAVLEKIFCYEFIYITIWDSTSIFQITYFFILVNMIRYKIEIWIIIAKYNYKAIYLKLLTGNALRMH